MRNIAKAQYGMSRSLRRKYMNPMKCKSPNDPGCGARRQQRIDDRQLKRQERRDEREERREEREKKRVRGTQSIGDYPKIVKREYYEGMDVGPGANSQFRRPKKILKASPSSREVSAKKGTKLKAQGGAKTPKDSSLIKRYSGPPFIKPKKPKAQYGVAKKSSKK